MNLFPRVNWILPATLLCLSSILTACSTGSVLTAKIHENKDWTIRLLTVPGGNAGKGYSHPSDITQEQLLRVLEGLYIEDGNFPELMFKDEASGNSNRRRVFNNVDAELLSIFLADGLSQASTQEIVTFIKTTDISSRMEQISSGGVYVAGDELHIVLSNFRVKQMIWQDLDSYEAPAKLRPMNPISTQPGRLGFDMPQISRDVPASESDFKGIWSGVSWHLAVQYKEL